MQYAIKEGYEGGYIFWLKNNAYIYYIVRYFSTDSHIFNTETNTTQVSIKPQNRDVSYGTKVSMGTLLLKRRYVLLRTFLYKALIIFQNSSLFADYRA